MDQLIRVASALNRVQLASPALSAGQLIPLIDTACDNQADIILAPLFTLSGAGCGHLFTVPSFRAKIEEQITKLAQRYADKNCVIVLGIDESTSAVLYQGRSYIDVPERLSFSCSGLQVAVRTLSNLKIPALFQDVSQTGADLFLLSSCHPVKAGDISFAKQAYSMLSYSTGVGLAFCNGGLGDTSAPYLYKGYCGGIEDGRFLAYSDKGDKGQLTIFDLDADIIHACKAKKGTSFLQGEILFRYSATTHDNLMRPVSMDPYLPESPQEESAFLQEVFDLQVKSLADRMANTGIQKLTIGISGGLDSTLAFLVSAAALDRLSLPRKNLIGITMPGFGTTGRTYVNAVSLIKAIGAEFREIHIADSVTQHLNDIGHDLNKTDVTYENAQARERAQILLDVANDNRAMVVGTGDLSEEALGWCTFAGDHIANYNVNVCVTKTMIRKIVSYLVEEERFADANEALTDILNSPVSPELLPPDENGALLQKTEEILGPYELHDFFLYYFIKYSLPPKKIFEYACEAFEHTPPEFILDKCRLFFRRLFGGQFKRSCTPDSAAIMEINLSNAEFYLPSDGSANEFIEELTRIDPEKI